MFFIKKHQKTKKKPYGITHTVFLRIKTIYYFCSNNSLNESLSPLESSYLFYFVKNIPADSKFKHQYELFGAEIDRYTYTSEVEKTYQSVDIKDDLKTEQRWHRHWVDSFTRKNDYDLVIYPAVEKVIPKRFSTPSIAVMNSILSVVKKNSSFKIRHQLQKGLENVQCIIAPSQYIKNDLIANKIQAEKIHVIYNGIDHKLFFPLSNLDPEFVEIKPFAIKRPYFIYGSRLSGPEKKHTYRSFPVQYQ